MQTKTHNNILWLEKTPTYTSQLMQNFSLKIAKQTYLDIYRIENCKSIFSISDRFQRNIEIACTIIILCDLATI